MSITVIGAGVAGLSIATELAERGAEVRIVDSGGAPGPHACSWWAGGMLAPFCEGETAPEIVVRHGMAAADWWEAHGASVTRNGSLAFALGRDRQELDRFARRTRENRFVNAGELAELEPDLAGRFPRALFFPTESHLAPRQALSALADGLQARGIGIQQECDHHASQVIDARGLSARDSLKDLRGVKGEMLLLRCPDITLSRPVRLLHPRIPIYLVPRGGGVYMLGATQIESNARMRATARSILELLSAAYALHPAFGEAEIIEIGVDARPAFPDNVPRIRRIGGTLYANGLFRHGFLMAPALARMTSDHILEGTTPELLQ
jgi:glycine oxidase